MQRDELNSAWPFLQQGGSKGAGHPFWGWCLGTILGQ